MANITVTYTFTNGTTADATEVNTNFSDLIAGTSDGTKDFSINALTVAGAAALNGNVTLGNATGDDITFTGLVASDIDPKTASTYSLGSSSLPWKDIHLDQGATDGGAIYFDAGATEFIKATAAGSELDISGFTDIDFNSGNIKGAGTYAGTGAMGQDAAATFNESGAAVDFRVEGDTLEYLFFVDGSTDRVGINTSSPTATFSCDGAAVFNESHAAVDFRVEGDTLDHLLFVDGSADRVGINTSSPTATFSCDGAAIFNESGNAADFRIESENVDNMFFVDANTDEIGVGTSVPNPMNGITICVRDTDNSGIMICRHETGTPYASSGEQLGNLAFKTNNDGANSGSAAEARIVATATENHSGSTAASDLKFYTKPSGNAPGAGNVLALTLDSSQNTTLAGTLTLGSGGSAIDYYEEDTLSTAWTNASGTMTGHATRIGNMVHVLIDNFGTLTATGANPITAVNAIASALRPAAAVNFLIRTSFNSGTLVANTMRIDSAGTVSLYADITGANFANTNTLLINEAIAVSYIVD